MRPFQYDRLAGPAAAIDAVASDKEAVFLAGGTTLLDLMKLNVMTPSRMVDINSVPLAAVEPGKDRLRIGALARMSDVAADANVRKQFPVVSEALLASASPQIRNMATIGGNVLQRTRCAYFRDTASACNKRQPGSGCAATGGENRTNAILGTSPSCIATHASDLAVALVAVDAIVRIRGIDGAERGVPIVDFYTPPGDTPNVENVLKHGELILSIDLPISPTMAKSHYLKVRDRASYEFAVVSVAVCLLVEGGRVADCRIALGGVATVPWRATAAEAALRGKPADAKNFADAAKIAVAGAKGYGHNDFKIEMVQRAVVRASTVLGEKQ